VTLQGPARRLTVILGEDDIWHHKPLYTEIVHRAHCAGMAGASVFRGIEGYGKSNHIHTSRILSLSEDLPVAVVIIDSPEKIEAFLREIEHLVTEGLIVSDDVHVHRYVGRPGSR
jgi:PII-like signaling protein